MPLYQNHIKKKEKVRLNHFGHENSKCIIEVIKFTIFYVTYLTNVAHLALWKLALMFII